MSAQLQEANLRLLPVIDGEIDELLAIRAEMVQELRNEGVVTNDRVVSAANEQTDLDDYEGLLKRLDEQVTNLITVRRRLVLTREHNLGASPASSLRLVKS